MKSRKIYLWLIDTGIIICIYLLVMLLSKLSFSSLIVLGEFTALKLLVFYVCVMLFRVIFGNYNSIWRYANVKTFLKLVISDILGGTLYFCIGRVAKPANLGFAYTLILVFATVIATLLSRFVYQIIYMNQSGRKYIVVNDNETDELHYINVAIVGAGNIGATLADEFKRNPNFHYKPFCFIDTDPQKIGKTINGIKVIKEDEHIVENIKMMPVQEIVIALPKLSSEEINRVYDLYIQTGCKVKIYDQPVSDDSGMGKGVMRELRIEDLLFRDTISLDNTKTKEFYEGKTVLVTGGGGSIGSELCRQVAKCNPKKLVIVDIYENNAYEIQQELIRKYGDKLDLETVIASVRDVDRLDALFNHYRPNLVFHAAAHKHVPLMEGSATEAIKNNVVGTYNVANAAEKYGVEKFLLISTDKAVNPTNIMGASKRLCEMVVQSRTQSKTEFTAVRFGNVLGSNGSVIPLFKKQIETGGPVTITDKRIIRYFMTISEAVSLVMETCAMANGGELYVLDMGEPVKILDLAERMIQLSGKRPYIDIDIKEIGLRPGEKLYEELLMKHEEQDKTENDRIFIERDTPLSTEEVEAKLNLLKKAAEEGTYEAVKAAIKETVPSFKEPEAVNSKL